MKIKSIISSIFLTAAMISSISVFSVSAEDLTAVDSNEISEIIEAVDRENNVVASGNEISVYSEDNNSFDLEISDYDVSKAYKSHILEYFMITEFKNNPDFKSLITNDVRIELPADGKLVSLTEDNSG